MKKLFAALLASALIVVRIQAETVTPDFPDRLPLGSLADLRSYALEKVKEGHSSVWSSSMIEGSESFTSIGVTGPTPGDIVEKLDRTEFGFQVVNTKDTVHAWAGLYSARGDGMFYGWASMQPELSAGEWRLPCTNLTLRLADYVPVEVPGAQWVRLINRDADGNILWEDYQEVYDGVWYVQAALAGHYGEIILTGYSSGKTVVQAYGMDGEKITPTELGTETSFTLQNYWEASDRYYSDPAQVLLAFMTMDVTASRDQDQPVYRLEVTKPSRKWKLYATVTENGRIIEQPRRVYVRAEGETTKVPLDLVVGGYTTIQLETGVYYLTYEIESLERPEPIPPYYGGGKG
jgi:hypothetical protein